ncbi:MAG: DUF3137 domain-containing protein [Pseudomonadota bacterium]
MAVISDFSFTERTEAERGLKAVFHAKIVPLLKDRETEQIRRRRNLFVGGGGVAVFGLLAGGLVTVSAGLPKGIAVGIVCLLVASMIAVYQQTKWRNRLGEQILPILAEFLGDMTYGQNQIEIQEFAQRGILPDHAKADFDDAMVGAHKGLKWALAEATLATKRGSRGGQRTVFRGLLLKIEIFGPAPRILMLPSSGAAADWMSELFSSTRKKAHRFETGIAAFDAQIISYAEDPDEARAYIDKRFADGLLELGKSVSSKPVRAAMEGSWLYLAIPQSRNLLSLGSLWKPVQEIEEELHHVIEELTLPRRVIEILSGR